MQTLGWIMAGLAVLMVTACLRTSAEQLLAAVLGLPATLLAVARSGAAAGSRHVHGVAARTRAALAYGGTGDDDAPAAWDVVAPLVYLVLLVLLAAGDLILAGLRFGALLGIPVDNLLVQGTWLDLLAGVLFLAILATLGCVLLDVLQITPLRRPYGLVEGRTRTLVLGAAAAGTALSVVSAVLFFVWGQDAIAGNPSSDAATLFIAIFAVILVTASTFAAGGALGAVQALWALLCGLVATLLSVCGWALQLAGVVVEGAYRLTVALVRLAARPGMVLWNWVTSLGVGRSLRLAALPEPGPVADLVPPAHQDLLALAAG